MAYKKQGGNSSSSYDDYAKEIADELIAQMEKGCAPWQKGWDASTTVPFNATTNKAYNGMNILLLMMAQMKAGYEDPRWITFKQAKDLGGNIKRGSHGVPLIYWKIMRSKKNDDSSEDTQKLSEDKVIAIPCRFTVFNVEQCENLNLAPYDKNQVRHDWEPCEAAEQILKRSGAVIKHVDGNRAFYSPTTDDITLPKKEQFISQVEYYDTALHELGHWTGHSSRLARNLGNGFGTEEYAKEELRAEIGSMMLSVQLGLPHNTENHAAYVKSWVSVLRNDPKEIFRAAADAAKISEFVMEFAQERKRSYVLDFDDKTFARMTDSEVIDIAKKRVGEDVFETQLNALSQTEEGQKLSDEDRLFRTASKLLTPAEPAYLLQQPVHKGIVATHEPARFVMSALWSSNELAKDAATFVGRFEGKAAAQKNLDQANFYVKNHATEFESLKTQANKAWEIAEENKKLQSEDLDETLDETLNARLGEQEAKRVKAQSTRRHSTTKKSEPSKSRGRH